MNMGPIWKQYEEWLLNEAKFRKRGYKKLIDQLHTTPFKTCIKMDKNRAGDGLYLRRRFCEETGMNEHALDYYDGCHILEMLIALAIRIDDEYIGNPANPSPDGFFWKMIVNLGLESYTDRRYDEDEVFDILIKWMTRIFKKNGKGSIFPIKKPVEDQRKLQIWDQAMEYLSENY